MGTGVCNLVGCLAVPTDLTRTTDVLSVVLLACIAVQAALIVLNIVWLVRGDL
jgi:hypothetical protein